MITNEGMNLLIDSGIRGGSQTATWYLALIDEAEYKKVLQTDTMSEHAGWIENTDYTQASRPQITFDAAANGKTKNSTAVTFTLNADATIRGFAICSNSTKGGTTGTLLATVVLSGPRTESSGNDINATVRI